MKASIQSALIGMSQVISSLKQNQFIAFAILFVFFAFSNSLSAATNSKHVITREQTNVDANKMNVLPGDTFYIEAGVRRLLRIANFHGTPENYIVFINCGGEVIIQGEDLQYGISVDNCSYFRFTGSGIDSIKYGIRIMKTKVGGTMGIGIGNKSTNYEIDHIEIANVGFAGIMAKTDPRNDLSTNRENFTQYQSFFHDNYIHNAGGVGMYIGHSFYTGFISTINDEKVLLYPSVLKGVRIYNNIVDSVGWDGIQVGSASEDCEIYNNKVTNYGLCAISSQHSGFQINPGTICKLYNNYVANGTGNGMTIFGMGNIDVYNNIIINAGYNFFPNEKKNIHGIFVDDKATIPGSTFNFFNNTIVSPKADGIRFSSVLSKSNKFYNNIILNPGSLTSYSKYSKQTPYINLGIHVGIDAILSNNYFDENPEKIQFEDIENFNFKLMSTSPAIEAGLDLSKFGVDTDFENNTRPIGRNYDLGAYQRVVGTETKLESNTVANFAVYPNPCRGKFNISRDESSKVDVTIYNLQGKVLKTSKNNTEKNLEFDVTDLAVNGKYYVTINDENGYSTKTLIIQ